jgi:hypothetical protein
MPLTRSEQLVRGFSSLARLASGSDSPGGLIAAARNELGEPLLLLDPDGLPLAQAPVSAPDAPSVAALRTVGDEPASVAPGWLVFPIDGGHERLAFLAAPMKRAPDPDHRAMLEFVASLVTEQLRRAALASAVRGERRAALSRRLVTDPAMSPMTVRREARAAGMPVASCYWPALLVWTVGHPGPRTLREVELRSRGLAPGSVTVPFDNATVAGLFPDSAPGAASRSRVQRWLADLVHHTRELGHHGVRAIAGDGSVGVVRLPARVAELQRLRRYLPHLSDETLVLPARWFALDRLLSEGLDRSRALTFAKGCIGRLVTHDGEYGTDLANVLELALDFPRRDDAARAAYMHRNTFRRHLRHALELVDADLEDPEDRLALHMALRLRRLVDAREHPGGGANDAAERARDRRSADLRA